jgi:hypothetical protein
MDGSKRFDRDGIERPTRRPSLSVDPIPPAYTHVDTQSPKGIALRTMLRSEFRRNANVTEPKQVEQLKMK